MILTWRDGLGLSVAAVLLLATAILLLGSKPEPPLSPVALLESALDGGDPSDAKQAIADGAPVDYFSVSARSRALHMAAEQADVEWTRQLLSAGANPNIANHDEVSPLFTAVAYGKRNPKRVLSCTRLLLDHGAKDGLSEAFRTTGRDAEVDLAKLLLDHGADVDTVFPENSTALMEAVAFAEKNARQSEYVKFLLSRGANPNPPTIGANTTALQYAVFNDRTELVSLLLRAGAKVGPASDYVDCCPKPSPVRSKILSLLDRARRKQKVHPPGRQAGATSGSRL